MKNFFGLQKRLLMLLMLAVQTSTVALASGTTVTTEEHSHEFAPDDKSRGVCTTCHHGFIRYEAEAVVAPSKNDAFEGTDQDGNYFKLNIVSNVKETDGHYYIEFDGPLTWIGNYAFKGCTGLTSITLPSGVTSIGYYAFDKCTGLKSVTLPGSVTSIGYSAFNNCSGLESITLPDAITTIEMATFSGCSGLKSVTLPSSLTSIGKYAFDGCKGLTSITIPDKVTTIVQYAFRNCSGLKSVTNLAATPQGWSSTISGIDFTSVPLYVPCSSEQAYKDANGWKQFTNIATLHTFAEDDALRSVCTACHHSFIRYEAKDVVTPHNTYFYGTNNGGKYVTLNIINNVKETDGHYYIEFDGPLTKIAVEAFQGCSGLTSVTLPSSLTSIGFRAFDGCTGLTSVTLPSSLASIEERAFDGCTGLTSITLPSSLTSIEYEAFKGCTGLTSITLPNSVNSIENGAFKGCTGLTSITLPSSVESIGENAFKGCTGLTSITLPSSVKSIGENAFDGCTGLKSVTNKATKPQGWNDPFSGIDFNAVPLFVPDAASIQAYKEADGWKQFVNIVVVGSHKHTFAEDDALRSVCTACHHGFLRYEAKDVVKPKKNDVFTGLDKDGKSVKLNIVSNVKESDGHYYIELDGQLTDIGAEAFMECKGLTSITLPSGVKSIGRDAFIRCTGLKSVTLPNSLTSIGFEAFSGCSGLTSITLPSSVTSIEGAAFDGCTGLKSVSLPNSLTSIGYNAFYDCSGLTSITLPNSVTSIGMFAFHGCSGLTSITLPNSLTSIENGTFSGCKGLTSVTLPNSVTSIGEYAFSNCKGLTSITLPSGVTSIGGYAFEGCSGMTSVTLPSGIISIGTTVFEGCSGLESVTNLATTPQGWGNTLGDINFDTVFLYVPCTAVQAYKDANGWKQFKNIVGAIHTYAEDDKSRSVCTTCHHSVLRYEAGDVVDPHNNFALMGTDKDGNQFRLNIVNNAKESDGHYYIEFDGTLTVIGGGAFEDCTGLTSVTIPSSVNTIEYYAFYGCTGLTSITLPNSVTSIGEQAFKGCSGLTSVTLPSSVTSIGNYAFYGCTGLTSITLPNSVTSIGEQAFKGCSGLKSVTNLATKPQGWNDPFGESYNYDNVTLYVPCAAVQAYKDTKGWKQFKNIVALHTYAEGDALRSVCTACHHSYIRYEAKAVVGPNEVNAFYGTDQDGNYFKLNIVSNVKETDGHYYIELDGTLTVIIITAFEGCSGLTSVTLPNSVTSIGGSAFSGCSGLKSVTIPGSVTSIGEHAFLACSGLTSVTNNATTPQAWNNTFSGIDFSDATLYVPYSAVQAYKDANGWKQFKNILPISGRSIGDLTYLINALLKGTTTNDMDVDGKTGVNLDDVKKMEDRILGK